MYGSLAKPGVMATTGTALAATGVSPTLTLISLAAASVFGGLLLIRHAKVRPTAE